MQELKESGHAYFERLMQVYREHSGFEDPTGVQNGGFVSTFVLVLHPELSSQLQNSVIAWQTKPVDEILQLAKYCSDTQEANHQGLKDRFMISQTGPCRMVSREYRC